MSMKTPPPGQRPVIHTPPTGKPGVSTLRAKFEKMAGNFQDGAHTIRPNKKGLPGGIRQAGLNPQSKMYTQLPRQVPTGTGRPLPPTPVEDPYGKLPEITAEAKHEPPSDYGGLPVDSGSSSPTRQYRPLPRQLRPVATRADSQRRKQLVRTTAVKRGLGQQFMEARRKAAAHTGDFPTAAPGTKPGDKKGVVEHAEIRDTTAPPTGHRGRAVAKEGSTDMPRPSSKQMTKAQQIAKELSTLAKADDTPENLQTLKQALDNAEEHIKALGIQELREDEHYNLDNLTLMKDVHALRKALEDIQWAKGEITENKGFQTLKERATALRKTLPDTTSPITVLEIKSGLSEIKAFYSASQKLYRAMSKTKFDKKTSFDLGTTEVGDPVKAEAKEYKRNISYHKRVAEKNMKKLIPQFLRTLDRSKPDKKGSLVSSAKTRGLTEGVGSQSETLLKYAKAYLENIEQPGGFKKLKPSEKLAVLKARNKLLEEIEDIKTKVKEKKSKTGLDCSPWTLHQAGEVDLFEFQNNFLAFIQGNRL